MNSAQPCSLSCALFSCSRSEQPCSKSKPCGVYLVKIFPYSPETLHECAPDPYSSFEKNGIGRSIGEILCLLSL
ncbi:unnamed protein product [Ectocarpus sp. 8 AP-2014]